MAKANDLRYLVGRSMPGKQVWNDEKNAALADVQSSANGIREYDVVCGKKANSNAGNEKFRLLIQRNRQTYQSTNTRDAKKKIIERIIEQVHTAGGRFLKVVGDKVLMEELSYEGCYEKVSQYVLREQDSATDCFLISPLCYRLPVPCDQLALPFPTLSDQRKKSTKDLTVFWSCKGSCSKSIWMPKVLAFTMKYLR
jgi:hypothetical protein